MSESVLWGVVGSGIASLGTGLGALPVMAIPSLSPHRQGVLLGLGAGVMLAATAFALIVPGVEAAQSLWGSQGLAAGVVALGMILGAVFLGAAHQYFLHEHFLKGREGSDGLALKRIWLFVVAIAIHNFPEGLAVGVGFGGEDWSAGIPLMVGIFLQNIPESNRLGYEKAGTVGVMTGFIGMMVLDRLLA